MVLSNLTLEWAELLENKSMIHFVKPRRSGKIHMCLPDLHLNSESSEVYS